jgi:energy-coupling factor transporter transmembrane protein EcfT
MLNACVSLYSNKLTREVLSVLKSFVVVLLFMLNQGPNDFHRYFTDGSDTKVFELLFVIGPILVLAAIVHLTCTVF